MAINLRLLNVFVLVAEHGSFKQAAEEVGRSQSAVSMHIKQLEGQLGVPLFHRTTRRVQLTAEGEQLLIHAKRAVGELENGLRLIKESVDMQSGHVSFGCVPTFASSILPSILAQYGARYPAISIHVREFVSTDLLASISRQQVDFGIGPFVENKSEFDFKPLMTEPCYALLPERLATPGMSSVTIEELSRHPMLTLSKATAFGDVLDNAAAARGVQFTSKFEFLQVATILAMVEAGLGAALLPEMAFSSARLKGVKVVPLDDPGLSRTICLVSLRGQAHSPAVARLVETIEQRTALAQSGPVSASGAWAPTSRARLPA